MEDTALSPNIVALGIAFYVVKTKKTAQIFWIFNQTVILPTSLINVADK